MVHESSWSPNLLTCGATLSALEKGQQWQLGVAFLHELLDRRATPNLILLNAVISACEKSEQWQYALFVASQIGDLKLQPSVVTYSALISACGRCGHWQAAFDVLGEFMNSNLQGNVLALVYADVMTLLSACLVLHAKFCILQQSTLHCCAYRSSQVDHLQCGHRCFGGE